MSIVNKLSAVTVTMAIILVTPYCARSQQSIEDLKNLSLEELMNIEVISVSKRPENLWESPSSIQVVKGEDLVRFGASNIPESLYLFGNLQVAQKGAHSFGVSARGFNTELANKLLVLMDGRTLYTPLFSGVYWERQDYLLADIDQIEVISGPGSTLWGANAVNGIINITTKMASKTQGLRAELGLGNELKSIASVRYGGKITDNTYYRVYGKFADRDQVMFADSIESNDNWSMGQGGFRMDSEVTNKDLITVQGDIYINDAGLLEGSTAKVTGANVLARWSHNYSENSKIRLQSYFDYTYMTFPTQPFVVNGIPLAPSGEFTDKLNTFDVDFQHQLNWGNHSHIVWGAGFRHLDNSTSNSPSLGFLPEEFDQNLFNIFVQDEIAVLKNLSLTLGTKLEHNPYTGYVWEPGGRIKWNLQNGKIIWGAVSKAVRTPSRVDRQLTQATPPNFVLLKGGSDFQSEILMAYELGFRTQVGERGTVSLSTYFNHYDDVRSTVLDPVNIFPLSFRNGLLAETYGLEVSMNFQINYWWQLHSGYSLMKENFWLKEGESDFNNTYNETADPDFQFLFRSTFLLPEGISINTAFRWIDDLPINNGGILTHTPSYNELDAQITWKMLDNLSLSLAGRNLLNAEHAEYGIPGKLQVIQRSIFGKITFSL